MRGVIEMHSLQVIGSMFYYSGRRSSKTAFFPSLYNDWFNMSESTKQHRCASPKSVRCAVVTISDTRTVENDRGGELIVKMLTAATNEVTSRHIVRDDPREIEPLLLKLADPTATDAILMTGGTGIAARDRTYETVSGLLTKAMPGYGELFRMLSYGDIGPAAMLSRAIGGVLNNVVVLTMPGSVAAVQLAMEKLIVPEIGHLVYEARK
jgi:molybdenum cofactor biosynthesis protein B